MGKGQHPDLAECQEDASVRVRQVNLCKAVHGQGL